MSFDLKCPYCRHTIGSGHMAPYTDNEAHSLDAVTFTVKVAKPAAHPPDASSQPRAGTTYPSAKEIKE